ncbi:MAG: class I SAM-dependent methyltransferase, partial [Flavobacteriaceae bacterium]|nr:class I SAM-dependent methyltransferase [Flavobacteriaceae bacterium]
MKKQITEYYNNLASYYDKNRFDNSYGRFINFQEIRILKKYLSEKDI